MRRYSNVPQTFYFSFAHIFLKALSLSLILVSALCQDLPSAVPRTGSEPLSYDVGLRRSLLVAGYEDGNLRLWDMVSGRLLRVLRGHSGPVKFVEVLDLDNLVSGSDDGTVRLWSIWESTTPRVVLLGGPISSLAVSEDKQAVLAASMPPERASRGTVAYFKVSNWNAPTLRRGVPVHSVAFSSGVPLFFNTPYEKQSIPEFKSNTLDADAVSGQIEINFFFGNTQFKTINVFACNRRLNIESESGTHYLYISYEPRTRSEPQPEKVMRLDLQSRSEMSVARPKRQAERPVKDGPVLKINSPSGEKCIEGRTSAVTIFPSDSGDQILTASSTGELRLWNLQRARVDLTLNVPGLLSAAVKNGVVRLISNNAQLTTLNVRHVPIETRIESADKMGFGGSYTADYHEISFPKIGEWTDASISNNTDTFVATYGSYVRFGLLGQFAKGVMWCHAFAGRTNDYDRVFLSDDGKHVVLAGWEATERSDLHHWRVWRNFKIGGQYDSCAPEGPGGDQFISTAAFSSGSDLLAIADSSAVQVLQIGQSTSNQYKVKARMLIDASALKFSEGDCLFIGTKAGHLIKLNPVSQESQDLARACDGSISSIGFLYKTVSAVSCDDGTVVLMNLERRSIVVKLLPVQESKCGMPSQNNQAESPGWVMFDEIGRFSASSLGKIEGFSWVFPDDPLRPLAPEIFMRDYYEPRLLPRLLACLAPKEQKPDACGQHFKPLRPLARLNRIQPEVKIIGVREGASPGEALVEVEALGKKDPTQPNGKKETAAYDLRLFRNGQLVGQWPEPKRGMGGPEDLQEWQHASLLPTSRHFFRVKLASKDPIKAVEFTAYAFNEDRVKSETTPIWKYSPQKEMSRRQARAYVITIGINGYENHRRNLDFAVKDARELSQALRQIQDYEVVSVSLLSEAPLGTPGKLDQATKENVRAVLRLLAGHNEDVARLRDVPNHKQLKQATPDDLVIVTFSGHGYTELNGSFYLLPSNSGKGDEVGPDSLKDFISSEELSEWLREADAGHMAMIIDACHSAASVETPGFKPGPMGDRGLGQLAYDKGMQILAASQADDVALEIENLRQGLLTYALREGLIPGKDGKMPAASRGEVTLQSLLKYAEQRVPSLYDDAKAGKVHMISRDPKPNPHFLDDATKKAQTPSLFDFSKQQIQVHLR